VIDTWQNYLCVEQNKQEMRTIIALDRACTNYGDTQ